MTKIINRFTGEIIIEDKEPDLKSLVGEASFKEADFREINLESTNIKGVVDALLGLQDSIDESLTDS